MNVALIMAKEGSLGVPGKNMLTLNGLSLVARTVRELQECKCFEHIYLSTNGKEIAAEAEKHGAQVIFRVDFLAKNENYVAAVNHAVSQLPADTATVTIPQVVQPFREDGLFARMLSLHGRDVDSVVTVTPFEASVSWIYCGAQDSQLLTPLENIRYGTDIARRSDLFEIDNAVVSFTFESWKKADGLTNWPYLGRRIRFVVQERLNSNFAVDINNPDDVEWMYFVNTYPRWRASRHE